MIVQLLSEEYKKSTENDEQRKRHREERKQKKLASKKSPEVAQPREDDVQEQKPEVRIGDLLAIPGPKFEQPLPPLPESVQPEKKEALHDITKDEMMVASLESSTPSEKEIEPVAKLAEPGSEKEEAKERPQTGSEPKDAAAKPKEKKPLDTIQENNSEFSNSSSARNGRHTRRQCNSALDHPVAKAASARDSVGEARQNRSFCSARESPAVIRIGGLARKYRVKSAAAAGNRSLVSAGDSKSPIQNLRRRVMEIRPNLMLPLRREDNLHGSNNSISTKGLRTINTLSKGYQATGDCSTSFTAETAGRAGKKQAGVYRLDQAFLAQMAEECRGTDNLTLSSAGLLFGAGPLSGYINLPTKGIMFQSFSTNNRPTLPSALALGSSNTGGKQGTGSTTIKRTGEEGESAGVGKKGAASVVGGLGPKIRVVVKDGSGDPKRVFRRIKVKKGRLL